MELEASKYLYDIQRAAGLISDFTQGTSFADYAGDAMLRSAVERQFEIAGEALAGLASSDASIASRISHFQRIIGFQKCTYSRLR